MCDSLEILQNTANLTTGQKAEWVEKVITKTKNAKDCLQRHQMMGKCTNECKNPISDDCITCMTPFCLDYGATIKCSKCLQQHGELNDQVKYCNASGNEEKPCMFRKYSKNIFVFVLGIILAITTMYFIRR
jgi:hypothetical protein